MTWQVNAMIVVQVICAIVIIVLVLLQHGKGADMGAAFGSGASGSLFGASGSANFLSRMTAGLATVFFVTTIGIAYAAHPTRAPRDASEGVMGGAPASAPASAPPSAPGAAPAAVPPPATAPAKGREADIPK